MVGIMKSLTQITRTCLSLILLLGCSVTYADKMNDGMTTTTDASDITIPLSGKEIKKNLVGPKRGTSMKQVEENFGKAIKIHPPKGKPPITRWDYPKFSVYFESSSVIHTVSRAN